VTLCQIDPGPTLKALLTRALGVLAVVDKTREIYFIGNVKFHIDSVKQLGSFVEIEAIDEMGQIGHNTLFQQCQTYMALLGIREEDLLDCSYSDMIIQTATP
jgi:predicted adenylyl cyclase CyaB